VFVIADLVGSSDIPFYDRLYLLLARAWVPWPMRRERLHALLGRLDIRLEAVHRVDRGTWTASAVFRALLEGLSYAEISRIIDRLQQDVTLPESDLRGFRIVSWRMLEEMRNGCMTIGSHTKRHALLTNESHERVITEIVESRRLLEARLGMPIRYFAYPDGRFNPAVVRALATAGYRAAFGACQHRDADHPTLTIPRRSVWERSFADGLGRFVPALMSCSVNGVFDRGILGCHGRALAG
jgi:hypothetical protein